MSVLGPHCLVTWDRCRGCGGRCVVAPMRGPYCLNAVCQARSGDTETRRCARTGCTVMYQVLRRSRQKYCSDTCAAIVWLAKTGPYNGQQQVTEVAIQGRVAALRRERVRLAGQYRRPSRVGMEQSRRTVPVAERRVVPRTPAPRQVVNTHVPGSFAYAMLYGNNWPSAYVGRRPKDEAQSSRSFIPHTI